MSILSVGIYGAAGYMGAPFSRALLAAHRGGLLRFVILHRPESNLSRYPGEIEKRELDIKNGGINDAAEKMKDLQVVISAASWQAKEEQYRLIDALKGSKELVTFFPSEYASPHNPEDLKSPFMSYSNEKAKVREYCKSNGVPFTLLANSTVPELLFNFKAAPSLNVRENKLELFWPLGNGMKGLTSREFSGQALVHLLRDRLSDLPNQAFSLVELQFSTQQLITLCTKLHNGQEPTIIKYTEEDYRRDMEKDFISALGAASKRNMAVGVSWPGEVISDFPGWKRRTLEDYVVECLAQEPVTMETLRNADLSKD